jgi:serine protease Do
MTFEIDNLGVFQVFTGGGTGTCFLIGDRLLLTNCHVVAPYRSVAIERRDRRRVSAAVRLLHPKRDLAILELSEPLEGEIFPLSTTNQLESKQTVYIVGFPVGLPLSITEGIISNPQQQLDGQLFVQTDAAINPGNSGGPMLDEAKQVVAVTTCKLSSADMVGFGIPASDASALLESFRGQTEDFGVMCPSCDALLGLPERYCSGCGVDLKEIELEQYFEPDAEHPVVAFVEGALRKAKVDPVLARHGEHNWTFHSGSAPVKIWACCSEHLCFSSPLAQIGKQKLSDLFRFLLSAEHAPFSFDLDDSTIRLNLTFHMSDVFTHTDSEEISRAIAQFIGAADEFDNILVDQYGCMPAPETQLTFLKEQSSKV